MYKWQQVKALQGQGKSIREIMRRVKLSRNTVRKYTRSSDPPRMKRREYERILDGFDREIMEMLSKGYIGTRIYEELLEKGYEGSLSTVHKYISRVKEAEEISGKVSTRVESSFCKLGSCACLFAYETPNIESNRLMHKAWRLFTLVMYLFPKNL